jgi:hypothetical protein
MHRLRLGFGISMGLGICIGLGLQGMFQTHVKSIFFLILAESCWASLLVKNMFLVWVFKVSLRRYLTTKPKPKPKHKPTTKLKPKHDNAKTND